MLSMFVLRQQVLVGEIRYIPESLSVLLGNLSIRVMQWVGFRGRV